MWNEDREPEYVDLEDCTIKAVTDKAILIEHDGDSVWVPKSVIEDAEQYEKWNRDVTVMVEEWFAIREELI